ncbi:hypothetical protein M405DRAFT_89235 [Rhizopogon salebrosus TDB-379]|nr:hypothetical protein M405DRAFT_89235 [Rhizopogon salebrosus TDB-379]
MRIVLTSQEHPADIEDDPRVPAATRPPLSSQSVYWSCKSPPMTPDPSASPSVQESPLSACLSCDSRVFSYATSYTTLPSPRDFADLGRGDVLGTIGSISEATLQSLAPQVAMMNVKHSCVGLDARSYPRLWAWMRYVSVFLIFHVMRVVVKRGCQNFEYSEGLVTWESHLRCCNRFFRSFRPRFDSI